MHKNILIATDDSELAKKAILYGLSVAKELQSRVIFVTVTEAWYAGKTLERLDSPIHKKAGQYEKIMDKWAKKVLSAAAHLAEEKGVSFETIHIKDQHPSEGIIKTAQSQECDQLGEIPAAQGGVWLACTQNRPPDLMWPCRVAQ